MTRRRAVLLAGAASLALYGGFLIRYTAFSVGGSDSSGYLNLARRAVSGRIVDRPRGLERLGLPDEFTQAFIPLGFVDGPRPGTMAPYYPIGFPLHEAAAAGLGGWERAPFLVSPLAAILSALLFFLLGRELELPLAWSAAGSLLFAAWPVLVGQGIQPMSDAVATFWCLAAVLLALRARRSPAAALAAGAAFGMAVLVRPTNALLLLPLAFALPISAARLALFAAGGLPLGIFLASYNLHAFGSVLQTGYGKAGLTDAIALSHFPPRFRHYGLWIFRTLTPIVPLLWLGLATDRRPAWRTRALLLSWFGAFFLFHCCYEPFDSFWFVRFLLPGAPALLLGALVVARDLAGSSRARLAIAAAAAAFVLVVEARGLRTTGVLDVAAYESTYPEICRLAQERLPERSVVVSMAASGALEYYTPLVYARWDWVDPPRWDGLRQRVEARGARFYALLFPFEAEELPKHMPGRWNKIAQLREVSLFELVTSPSP